MIRDRLKEVDIKITELSEYLQISRPTMYKFIEDYDNGDKKQINKKIIKLFDYIENNPLIGKRTIINYILNNLVEVKELGDNSTNLDYSKVKKYLINNPQSTKSEFIKLITEKDYFDSVIDYLTEIKSLIKKRKLTDEQIELLKPFDEIINIMETKKGEN